jgi:predicted membrane channel-forming protein YqfA (hemolysin III family)
MKFCLISNIIGLIPILYGIINKQYFLSFSILISVLLSTFYHIDESNRIGLLLDIVGCFILTTAVFYYIINSNEKFTICNLISFILAICAIFSFLAADDDTTAKQYELYHTLWHVFSLAALWFFLFNIINTKNSVENKRPKICKKIKFFKIPFGENKYIGFVRKKLSSVSSQSTSEQT